MRRHPAMLIPVRFLAFSLLLAGLLSGCGDPPGSPVERRGNVALVGTLTTGLLADSIHVIFDSDTLGYHSNPDTLWNVFAGTHFVEIRTVQRYASDTLEYFSAPRLLEVSSGQTVAALCTLSADIPVSPFAGYMAPDFNIQAVNLNQVCLDSLRGEVVLLYFFSFS